MSGQVVALGNSPDKFLEFIYGVEEGYCYIATKEPLQEEAPANKTPKWTQTFFLWPDEREAIKAFIQEKSATLEVFFSPALFKEKNPTKEHVKGSRVLWCEFDGKVPTELNGVPKPSLRVQSSIEGREHWYWMLDEFAHPYDFEKINRALTYTFEADASGWDANQVLRPVGTLNHKRQQKVVLLEMNLQERYNLSQFQELPEPPPTVEAPLPDHIPPVEDVIWKYRFDEFTRELFTKGDQQDRSKSLMHLGYRLAEMHLSDSEMFALLLNADQRWGKFAGRNDQYQRLMEIVVRARLKHPHEHQPKETWDQYGFMSLLQTEVHVEWILEGILQEQGMMLLTGPSGVGKTQFTMAAVEHLALGKEFLGIPVARPRKVGFFSLEMGLADFKFFAQQQATGYSAEEMAILEENFQVFPFGEPLYLGQENEANRVREIIESQKFDIVVFDSLGSTTDGALSDEVTARRLMDWNDRLRNETGVATWFIHHHRKATSDNRKPNKLSDVYGSQYFTARATSVLCLWETKVANSLELLKLKVRLSPNKDTLHIFRNSSLLFQKKTGVTVIESSEEEYINANKDPKDKFINSPQGFSMDL